MGTLFIFGIIFIVTFVLVGPLSLVADASIDSDDQDDAWQTEYLVGRFLNSDPPREDKIFKFQYRVIGGTVEEFKFISESKGSVLGQGIDIRVNSSTDDTVLEITIPRNFPYTNNPPETPSGIDDFVFLSKDGGNIEATRNVTECFFVFSVAVANRMEMILAMSSVLTNTLYHGDDIQDSCLSQTLLENVPVKNDGTISPPQQRKAGVLPEHVRCPEGLHLFIRSFDDKIYCINSELEDRFIDRGWISKLKL